MAEQSGQDTEVERAGEAEGEQESVQPAKRVIWTPERLAKAAATRAETKRKKEEKEARKAAKRQSHKPILTANELQTLQRKYYSPEDLPPWLKHLLEIMDSIGTKPRSRKRSTTSQT